jgi:hypothetical protein
VKPVVKDLVLESHSTNATFMDRSKPATASGINYNNYNLQSLKKWRCSVVSITYREMMSLGSSHPWNVALKVLTLEENPKMDAQPLMDYYQPLHEWLVIENRRLNYTIGFD